MSGLCLGNQCMWITTTFAYFIKVTGKESMAWKYSVHPRNSTWNTKMKVWKMRFLFQMGDFQVPCWFSGVEWLFIKPLFKVAMTTRALGCDFSHVVCSWCIFTSEIGEDSYSSGKSPRTFVPCKNLTYTSPSSTCNLKISVFQKEALVPKCHFSGFHNPYHPCMVYLPTFTINIW